MKLEDRVKKVAGLFAIVAALTSCGIKQQVVYDGNFMYKYQMIEEKHFQNDEASFADVYIINIQRLRQYDKKPTQ